MNPIRVLHLGNEMQWRGGENQIRLLIENSRNQGIEHHVAYPTKSEALPRFGKICSICPLPSKRPYDFRSILKIHRYCKANKIQILHAQSSAGLSLALTVKTLNPKLKLVSHRRVAFPLKSNLFSRKKYKNPKIDHYICISEYIRKMLIEYKIDLRKISVAKSAIDTSAYASLSRENCRAEWLTKFDLSEPQFLICMASALTNEKGHDTAIKALAKVRAQLDLQNMPIQLFIAGAGPELAYLRSIVESQGLHWHVKFLGKLDRIAGLLKAADLLLVPSRFEGLGTIVLEGMAAQTVVVGSSVGGIPEMIKNNETGFLVKPDDVDGLAAVILDLYKRRSDLGNIRHSARQLLEKDFSLAAMVSANVSVYKKILA